MRRFRHINAHTLEEASSALQRNEGRAVIIAGGTDLLGVLKDDILPEYPDLLINIKTIPGFDRIREDAEGLKIGALAQLCHIANSDVIRKRYPLLSDAAKTAGSPEIRNMGTLGGNLCQDSRCWYYRYPHRIGGRIMCYRKGMGKCHAVKGDNRYHAIFDGKVCFAVCPSDTAVALAALGAQVKVTGPGGERAIPIRDFYNTLGTTLKPGEILKEIHVPRPPEHTLQRFIKFRLRDSVDFAIVSVAVSATMREKVCQDARIVLGAVAPTPYFAEEAMAEVSGRTINDTTAAAVAEASVAGAKPLSRNGYKVDIARALVQRAILSLAAPH